MENTLEKIEKAWVAIGSLITILGLTGNFPILGELFTPNVASQIIAIVGAFVTIVQFFRGSSDEPVEIPDVEVRSLNAPRISKLNSTTRHALLPWSKRHVG